MKQRHGFWSKTCVAAFGSPEMKLIVFRQDNAWWVSFEGSMALPFKHLDTVIDHLQRRYPEAEIVMPEPMICGTEEERPNLKLVKS
jgi:hypothetical protein